MKFRVEHVIEGIDLPSYERLYFNEAFNIALCQAVNLERTLVNLTIRDGKLSRAVKVSPDREIPAPVAKVLGAPKIEYTEYIDYTLGSFRGSWKTVSALMTDKVDSSGSFGFESRPNGVLRWVEGEVKVKIFGLGGVVERVISMDIEKSYKDAAEFTRTWIKNGKGEDLPALSA